MVMAGGNLGMAQGLFLNRGNPCSSQWTVSLHALGFHNSRFRTAGIVDGSALGDERVSKSCGVDDDVVVSKRRKQRPSTTLLFISSSYSRSRD